MSNTFRQAVEDSICNECFQLSYCAELWKGIPIKRCPQNKRTTDRICAAAVEMAERMPSMTERAKSKAILALHEQEVKPLVGLLRMAKCPDCDGSGGIPRQVRSKEFITHDMAVDAGLPEAEGRLYSEESFELEQCQWCDERKQVLAKIDAALEGK